MMNYQHFYHAGNHADVFKHLVLLGLLQKLLEKSKAFCVIDTHAGSGKYAIALSPTPLSFSVNNFSQPPEWLTGIGLLQQQAAQITDPLLKHYLHFQADLRNFKGSPLLAAQCLRAHDALILIEKADTPYQMLRKLFLDCRNVHIHHITAETALQSLLPPTVRRGLVFIDPPYENLNELEKWPFLLKKAYQKFPTACYALWYPIKARARITQFYRDLQENFFLSSRTPTPKIPSILICECCPWPDDFGIKLNGSGMAIINPPWAFETLITPALENLTTILKQQAGGFWQVKKLN